MIPRAYIHKTILKCKPVKTIQITIIHKKTLLQLKVIHVFVHIDYPLTCSVVENVIELVESEENKR